MKINLPYRPERPAKPRNAGITMMMDKGLSTIEVESFIENNAPYTDLVKLGFGTSVFSSNVEKKISLYHQAGIRVYFGGTLFEAFVVRNMFDDYIRLAGQYKLTVVEVSDGSMFMHHSQKLEYIQKLSKNFTVLSEVGSKQKSVEIADEVWVEMMKTEIQAGSWKVIGEARESGTIGIYHSDGSVNTGLIDLINKKLDPASVIWEAPSGKQQAWFIKQMGPNVNLGNIAYNDVVPLECLRQGLRGDTFLDFLPGEMTDFKPDTDKYRKLD